MGGIGAGIDPIFGLSYADRFFLSPTDNFAAVIESISLSSSSGARKLVVLPAGEYGPIHLTAYKYVDVRGPSTSPADCVIWTDDGSAFPLGDTLNAGDLDGIWGHMTLEHRGSQFKYAAHVDSGTKARDTVFVNVVMRSGPKQAIGIGGHPNQRLFIYDSVFEKVSGPSINSAFYCHSFQSVNGNGPFVMVVDGCTIRNLDTAGHGNGVALQDFDTGYADEVYIIDSPMHGTAAGVDLQMPSPIVHCAYYIDPTSYTTFSGDAPQGISGVTAPTPTRMPTRY